MGLVEKRETFSFDGAVFRPRFQRPTRPGPAVPFREGTLFDTFRLTGRKKFATLMQNATQDIHFASKILSFCLAIGPKTHAPSWDRTPPLLGSFWH